MSEKLSSTEAKELVEKQTANDMQQVNRIIRGVNDVWEKHYNLPQYDMDFTISIKAPNVLDYGVINAKREEYLKGMGAYTPEATFIAYHMLATIRTVGVKVPQELEKDEEIFNLAILYQIGIDFTEWLDTFQR